MEGQVLGNRYELIEKIGGGGMALVYKARCRLLNRFVAIKILRPEFTNDEEFVKRFRIEAQSVASLSHPNIVSIYDVGHEGDIHYIVMEYVQGITLKEYISKKGALESKEAVNIAIQICSAIEHAHMNNIVHRDIKPHNILLTRDGIAKVTDFGIARAVSSTTITMVGSTIGSVHYFSPEQARGGYTDEKSDLYSLGIALYEMVTGRVPFDGETPVAVALKHIQTPAQEPVLMDSNIPKSVNDIIMKAIKKEQNKRYQTASEMLGDLYRSLKEPDGGFVEINESDNSPTRRVRAIQNENLLIKDDPSMKDDERKSKKNERLTIWLAALMSVILIGVFVYVGYRVVTSTGSSEIKDKDFVLENYAGRNFYDVKKELEAMKIQVKDAKKKYDDKYGKDMIITQSPAAGSKMKIGGYNSIEFEISDGPNLIKLVDLKNTDYRIAEGKINELGLIASVTDEFSDTVATGRVIRTDPPANEEVKSGSVVTIYKSKGPEVKQTEVPNLIGKNRSEALKLLSDAKLVTGKITPPDSVNFIIRIIRQDPPPKSSVAEGSAVDIEFENDVSQRRLVIRKVNLTDPQNYSDKIKVLVEITPSDTGKVETLMSGYKDKKEFPLSISIPVPDKGSSKVRIYFNDKLYVPEFTEESPGR